MHSQSAQLLRAGSSPWRALAALWARLSRRSAKRLRLCESVPLGERRFVAVVEFEGQRFLLGGGASSVVLLSRLGGAPDANQNANDDPAIDRAPRESPERSRSETW